MDLIQWNASVDMGYFDGMTVYFGLKFMAVYDMTDNNSGQNVPNLIPLM
jgi:hypothetical protein